MDLCVEFVTFGEMKMAKHYAESKGLVYDSMFSDFSEYEFNRYDKPCLYFNKTREWGLEDGGVYIGKDFSLTQGAEEDSFKFLSTKTCSMTEVFRAIDDFLPKKVSIKIGLKDSKYIDDMVCLSSNYEWRLENNLLICYEK